MHIGYLLSIKQVIFFLIFSLITGDKTDFLSASDIVKLIHNWELTFRILPFFFFFFFFAFLLLSI